MAETRSGSVGRRLGGSANRIAPDARARLQPRGRGVGRMPAKRSSTGKTTGKPQRRREFSAGGVVWRRSGDSIEVVLVRPAGKDVWTLPKGLIGQGEHVIDAAARETREETGLIVTPEDRIGDISYVYSWHDTPE